MSKARMTFRFENTRRAAGGQAPAEAQIEQRELAAPEAALEAPKEADAEGDARRTAKAPASNVI
ncbi:MAG TPA: hypothetical protein VEZ72_08255, partial [Paenibacillus sp.]|nr:hypothetical protein [Paenibacillus sp.]